MKKITSANCVKEIVALCANPEVVRDALHRGADELEALTTDEDIIKHCGNPKNWKRKGKQKRWDRSLPITIERCYECTLNDQLRAYVSEEGGGIVQVFLSNATWDAAWKAEDRAEYALQKARKVVAELRTRAPRRY
jgi:hypothetical protein